MKHDRKAEVEIKFGKKKNRVFMIFMIAVMAFILVSTLFYDTVYKLVTSLNPAEEQKQVQVKRGFALKYNGYDLTASARQN